MTLIKTIETLEGRTLSDVERNSLRKFELMFEIGEDDPLNIVLAMMAKNQLKADQLPELLQQKAKETIELHQQTLREQSTLIAKELVVSIGNMLVDTIATQLAGSAVGKRMRLLQWSCCLMGGFIFGGLCVRLLLR